MKIIIENNMTTVLGPDKVFTSYLFSLFAFTDKSKEYQLKRMAKNPFLKASAGYQAVQNEVYQNLATKQPDGSIVFPSGLISLIDWSNLQVPIEDLRGDTGTTISLPWKQKPFDLRPYQEETVEAAVNSYRGLIKLATGLGKTLSATHLIRSLRRKTLVVCPSAAIADQFYNILCAAFGDDRVGYYGGGKKKIKDITVGIAQSVVNGVEQFKKTGLGVVIFDEVHHIAANTFFSIAKSLGDVGRMYGLTATDFRSDGKDMMITAGCGPTIIDYDVSWGIQNGYLATPSFLVRQLDTKAKDYPDDKLKNYKSHVLNCDVTKKQILSDAQQSLNAGKVVVILVDEISHGEELAKQLGLPFAQGNDKDSDKYINDFNAGKVKGLIGTEGKLGEGVDLRPTQVLIMANFVAAKGAVLQAIGRGLRMTENKKTCLIIDYKITNSKMFSRHCDSRIKIYKSMSDTVIIR